MSTILKWGLITGMVYVVFSLLSNMLGLQQGAGGGGNWGIGLLVNTVLMVATFFTIYLGIKETRDEDKGGYITLGEGFMTGFKIALIAAGIAGVFTFIYMQFIDPTMGEKILSGAEDQWDEMDVPEDQREMGRKFTGIFTSPLVMGAFSIAYVLFWGVIKALVAGNILKKLPPPTMTPTVPTDIQSA